MIDVRKLRALATDARDRWWYPVVVARYMKALRPDEVLELLDQLQSQHNTVKVKNVQ